MCRDDFIAAVAVNTFSAPKSIEANKRTKKKHKLVIFFFFCFVFEYRFKTPRPCADCLFIWLAYSAPLYYYYYYYYILGRFFSLFPTGRFHAET